MKCKKLLSAAPLLILCLSLIFLLAACDVGGEVTSAHDGADGKSAYELACEMGYKGTLEEWLLSLAGEVGADGESAYEIAVKRGYKGTEDEWLMSLVGASGQNGSDGKDGVNGKDGADGKSAYELACESGFNGTLLEWLDTLIGKNGENGKNGSDGKDGENGKDGADGREVEFTIDDGYVKYKYTGEDTWKSLISLDLLSGKDGENGKDGADGKDGENGKDGADGKDGENGKDGADGKDGENGKDGQDGKSPAFRVENGILQWQYVGDALWTDLFNLNGLVDNQAPDTESKKEYDFGEFISLDEPELAEVYEKNGIKTIKYKVGTMYYVPISYGFIQQIYPNTSLTLGYSLSEATETSIEQGINRAQSIGFEFGLSTGDIGIETEISSSISVEHIYNYIQTTTNSEQYSGSYSVYATDENAGKYCRIALVTNVDYYVCYRYDIFNPTKIGRYTSTECQQLGDAYQFVAKLQFSDTETFEEPEINDSVLNVTLDQDRLEQDGLFDVSRVFTFEGTYTDSDVIMLEGFTTGSTENVLWSEVQNFNQLFGSKKSFMEMRKIPIDMKLSYTFTYNKLRNMSSELKVLVTNGIISQISPSDASSIDTFVKYIDSKVEVLADIDVYIPIGDRNRDRTITIDNIAIPFEDVGENFYVYLINTSNDGIEIKDHIYTYTLTPNLEKLAQTTMIANRNTTIKVSDGQSKNDRLDFVNIPDITVEELIEFGFTKLNATITFKCEKRGALPPLLSIIGPDGKQIATASISYENANFATAMQNSVISTTATATFTIDLTVIDSIDITLVWSCLGATGTIGNKYISTSNLSAHMTLE